MILKDIIRFNRIMNKKTDAGIINFFRTSKLHFYFYRIAIKSIFVLKLLIINSKIL